MSANFSDQGDWVKAVTCPRCKQESVVYNGNYFCGFASCGWAMSERRSDSSDHIIRIYLSQRLTEAEEKGDTVDAAAMRFYLNQLPRLEMS
jgi:hypothetical protein